jgi:cellulose synthase/poly-beta-1,6-N-acetylglucosamine synthase-like glycosyltransferase
MLSILIPVYNYNINDLITELKAQCSEQQIEYEIIVMEDGSNIFVEENKTSGENIKITHIVLKNNIGRAAIRNKLAQLARFPFLLFLDCDSAIPSKQYIKRYLAFTDNENNVVAGGRIYDYTTHQPECSLVKKYGFSREKNIQKNLKTRTKFPVLTTPNFLISKRMYLETGIDETISGYGHEDTALGIKLKRNNATIYFIDNPVIHIGLDTNDVYISKTENALFNLYKLYSSGEYPELVQVSKILSYYLKLKRLNIDKLIRILFHFTKKWTKMNLLSANPSLFLFDFYKLGMLCQLNQMDTTK